MPNLWGMNNNNTQGPVQEVPGQNVVVTGHGGGAEGSADKKGGPLEFADDGAGNAVAKTGGSGSSVMGTIGMVAIAAVALGGTGLGIAAGMGAFSSSDDDDEKQQETEEKTKVPDDAIRTEHDFTVAENNKFVTMLGSHVEIAGTGFQYSFAGGEDQGHFNSEDLSSGKLKFINAPDGDRPGDANGDNAYKVNVLVKAGSKSQLMEITVTVRNLGGENPTSSEDDKDDEGDNSGQSNANNPSEFNDGTLNVPSDAERTSQEISVRENNKFVGFIKPDSEALKDSSAPLSYSISDTHAQHYELDEQTGRLKFKGTPDFEGGVTTHKVGMLISNGTETEYKEITINILDT